MELLNVSFGDLLWVIRNCHFYDPHSGYYKDSAQQRAVMPGEPQGT